MRGLIEVVAVSADVCLVECEKESNLQEIVSLRARVIRIHECHIGINNNNI